jgi:hypothetical protein
MTGQIKATPTTLVEAVTNGIEDSGIISNRDPADSAAIASHVRDFLSNKFSIPMLKYADDEAVNNVLRDLWKSIIE